MTVKQSTTKRQRALGLQGSEKSIEQHRTSTFINNIYNPGVHPPPLSF